MSPEVCRPDGKEMGGKATDRAILRTREHLEKYGMFNARCCLGLLRENCIDGSCCGLVRFYASMGLHRYNLLKVDESELQANDWIRLYLELSVAISDRTTDDHDLSKLKIVKVAIETSEPPSDLSLTAKNATVYIRYIDFCEARCGGKNFDRIAVVRRTFVKHTGCFSLDGWNQSSDIIPGKCHLNQSSDIVREKGMSLSRKLLTRRLIHKSRRMWRRRAYTNHRGVGRPLCKTRSIQSTIKKYTQISVY